MYRSKELGRNTYQFLDANLAEHRLQPAYAGNRAARRARRTNLLQLHYQPMVRIARQRAIIGAEALLRWNDPEHGSVPPQVFIPLAEESGLIHALGEWVLAIAAEQCAAWRDAGLPLTVSINLSARQFYREDLAQRISDIVKRRRLRAVVDRARGDRDEPAARPRRDPQGAARAARRRLRGRDRRLRHRLLVADAPEALPDRHAQDRHLVHRRPRVRPAATRRSPRRSSASRAASG